MGQREVYWWVERELAKVEGMMVWVFWVWMCMLLPGVFGMEFYVHPGHVQCFDEEIRSNMTVKGEVLVLPDPKAQGKMEIDLWVRKRVHLEGG